jgi:lipopolysaccharide transport system permease protein
MGSFRGCGQATLTRAVPIAVAPVACYGSAPSYDDEAQLSDAVLLATPRSNYWLAWHDLIDASRHWRLILHLSWQDVRQRYRRSALGPLWLTVSVAVQIGSLGLVYGELFHLDLKVYLPHLAVGLTVWAMFATTINDGCLCFISAESFLKQVALPKGIFPARVVLRSLITFAHDVVILVIVLAIYSPPSILGVLASLMGIAIFAFNGLWIGLLFGLLSARFRDLAPIVGSVMQVAFFLTPVIWLTTSIHGRLAELLQLNPFAAFLSMVRDPLLGLAPTPQSWAIVALVTVLGWIVAFLMFARFRGRITYWL